MRDYTDPETTVWVAKMTAALRKSLGADGEAPEPEEDTTPADERKCLTCDQYQAGRCEVDVRFDADGPEVAEDHSCDRYLNRLVYKSRRSAQNAADDAFFAAQKELRAASLESDYAHGLISNTCRLLYGVVDLDKVSQEDCLSLACEILAMAMGVRSPTLDRGETWVETGDGKEQLMTAEQAVEFKRSQMKLVPDE